MQEAQHAEIFNKGASFLLPCCLWEPCLDDSSCLSPSLVPMPPVVKACIKLDQMHLLHPSQVPWWTFRQYESWEMGTENSSFSLAHSQRSYLGAVLWSCPDVMSDSHEFLLVDYLFCPGLGTHPRPSLLTCNILVTGVRRRGPERQDTWVSLLCSQGLVSLYSMGQSVFRGFAQLCSLQ